MQVNASEKVVEVPPPPPPPPSRWKPSTSPPVRKAAAVGSSERATTPTVDKSTLTLSQRVLVEQSTTTESNTPKGKPSNRIPISSHKKSDTKSTPSKRLFTTPPPPPTSSTPNKQQQQQQPKSRTPTQSTTSNPQPSTDVFERLYEGYYIQKSKLEELQRLALIMDPTTGKKLWSPELTPKSREIATPPTGSLYDRAIELRNKKNQIQTMETQSVIKAMNESKMTGKTMELAKQALVKEIGFVSSQVIPPERSSENFTSVDELDKAFHMLNLTMGGSSTRIIQQQPHSDPKKHPTTPLSTRVWNVLNKEGDNNNGDGVGVKSSSLLEFVMSAVFDPIDEVVQDPLRRDLRNAMSTRRHARSRNIATSHPFSPTIAPRSRLLDAKRLEKLSQQDPALISPLMMKREDTLLLGTRVMAERKQELLVKHAREELKECTFSPHVNRSSKAATPRVYEPAPVKRQPTPPHTKPEFTFHPTIKKWVRPSTQVGGSTTPRAQVKAFDATVGRMQAAVTARQQLQQELNSQDERLQWNNSPAASSSFTWRERKVMSASSLPSPILRTTAMSQRVRKSMPSSSSSSSPPPPPPPPPSSFLQQHNDEDDIHEEENNMVDNVSKHPNTYDVIVSVNLGEERGGLFEIGVCQGDSPEQLAGEFAQHHQLSTEEYYALVNLIAGELHGV